MERNIMKRNMMKRNSIIVFILSASIIFSSCTGNATTKTEVTDTKGITVSPTEITDIPVEITAAPTGITAVPSDVANVMEGDFTEGVWIKKYPDNLACFKFETPEGYQIVCDPCNVNETLNPDIVTESHQDLDHRDTTNLDEPYELITEPGEYNIDDVVIRGFAGKHNSGPYPGTNNIYVFTINDITIAHFASQGELPSDEVLEQIGDVDVLLIQLFVVPDYNKMLMKDADVIIEKLNPKIIIPEHGDAYIGGQLAKRLTIEEVDEPSGEIIITRDMLDNMSDMQVLNLDTEVYR